MQRYPRVSEPEVRTLWRTLPGRAMSAVVMTHSTLWLIVDPDKSDAMKDAAANLVTLLAG